jgi:hypothetical protein
MNFRWALPTLFILFIVVLQKLNLYEMRWDVIADKDFLPNPSFFLEQSFALYYFSSNPFGDRGNDCVTKESPSTTVHPGGNPISFSHSVHVKFLATEYWSV